MAATWDPKMLISQAPSRFPKRCVYKMLVNMYLRVLKYAVYRRTSVYGYA